VRDENGEYADAARVDVSHRPEIHYHSTTASKQRLMHALNLRAVVPCTMGPRHVTTAVSPFTRASSIRFMTTDRIAPFHYFKRDFTWALAPVETRTPRRNVTAQT
jgi:hypothetical protein